ncbi:UNVERIFIED_ORG: hypothetical protein J2W38_005347 [Variovorax paradoxus]|nr:hypothetical protein [Variovorax paradoxus]
MANTKTLTRSELYELVWARPRSMLAKEFGISDVAIGKHCAQARIPVPPPGYWARKAVDKAGRRPALPIRLPGHPLEITFGSQGYGYWSAHEVLSEPITPPEFSERLDEQVAAAMKMVGKVAAHRDLSSPHRALKRVLDAEARRREKHLQQDWGFYKPYFDEPPYPRQLRLFNSIARAMTPVTTGQEVFSQDEWIQGIGTLHFLKMKLQFGDCRLELSFLEPGTSRNQAKATNSKGVGATTLRTGSESSSLGVLAWTDQPGEKLEAQLSAIVQALLSRAELSMRHSAQSAYEYRVERRREIEKKREAAERAREAKYLEEVAAHRERVRQHIIELGQQRRAAQDIRDMVSALSTHPDFVAGQHTHFEEWIALALNVADGLDPMKRSIDTIINGAGIAPVRRPSTE